MYARQFLAFLIVAVFCGAIAAQQPDETRIAEESNTDTWLGGFGSLDEDQFEWRVATLELAKEGSNRKGKLKTSNDRRYTVRLSQDGEDATVIVRRRRVDRTFTGRLKNRLLVVTADDGQAPNRMVLRQLPAIPPTKLAEMEGVYEVTEGHRIGFRSQGQGLSMTDYLTGQVRFLYPIGKDFFVAGSAIAIPDPIEFQFQFQRDDENSVTGVLIQPAAKASLVAKRRPKGRIEEFVFESFDGTKIAGSLYRPAGEGPFPAIVCVHGSGMATRSGVGGWPLYYADQGFAVLAVDKRGMGKSEGNYHLPDGGRDNFPHMRRRSKDVSAAVKALAKLDDIRGDRIGLSGGSQAGWVIPMSVGQAEVAFAIIFSGGATPLSIEGRYSRLASEDSSGSQLPSVDDLIAELRSYDPPDPGIDQELIQIDFPCLWLYGYKDRSNPSQICEELINDIAQRHGRDFTVKAFPNGNHGLLECRFGGSAEFRALDRLVPDLHATIEKWLAEKQLLSK